MSGRMPVLSAEEIRELLAPREARAAILDALLSGLDPAADPMRIALGLSSGELLLMPAETSVSVGVKLVTVAPEASGRALPRIQGAFVLFDAGTLAPVAVMDGAALTALRTPAVSFAAVGDRLLGGAGPLRAVVFGAGPQAVGHVAALVDLLAGIRPLEPVAVAVRRERSLEGFATPVRAVVTGSPELRDALAEAELVVCATTASEPLFDSALLRPDAVVIAMGSHSPDARELDSALLARATVVVEDVATALREAGDVVIPCREGVLDPDRLVPLVEAVRGLPPDGRPLVFKGTGMSWQDVVVAERVRARRNAAEAAA